MQINTLKSFFETYVMEQSQPQKGMPAAVLIPLILQADESIHILLTKRSEDLSLHAGQICFPGGRIEPQDSTATEAALRETYEEVGIPPQHVEILGSLPPYPTITDFLIQPFVGIVHSHEPLKLDPQEVVDVFQVPLEFILDLKNYKEQTMKIGDKERHYFILSYKNYKIWGATAGILHNLALLLLNDRSKNAHPTTMAF
jgi:8-oxo-dGTP pyrophosphatase MutT (NUDIX family)